LERGENLENYEEREAIGNQLVDSKHAYADQNAAVVE